MDEHVNHIVRKHHVLIVVILKGYQLVIMDCGNDEIRMGLQVVVR